MAKTQVETDLIAIGLKKGYLSNKKVILKPIFKTGKMIKDPTHSGAFMYDGAQVSWCIPRKLRGGDYASLFETEEERQYFEDLLGIKLNLSTEEGKKFYKNLRVKFIKSSSSMLKGESYDLSDPMENIRVRLLRLNNDIAPNWASKDNRAIYKFALVDEHYEDDKAAKVMDANQKLWMFVGSIKDSKKKLSQFLSIYFMMIRSGKQVPEDSPLEWLQTELNMIVSKDQNNVLNLIDDPKFETKIFILSALKVGAIQKQALNSYVIPGIDVKYTFTELVNYMHTAIETTEDVYFKINAQIEQGK